MGLDEKLMRKALALRERLLELERAAERARADYHEAIRRLHDAGGSMREIGESLGLSHQRVHQVVAAGREALLVRLAGRPKVRLDLFTKRAREVVVLAQEEADAFRHDHIGTEHLLLGLLREQEGLAARVLDALGVGLEQARAEVVRIVGEGEPDHEAGRPRRFTPRAKKALQLAFREARTLLSDAIDTEHVLLGLIRDRDAVAARILAGLGAEAGVVRVELFRVLQRAA